jgi:hypothetical protein
MLSPFEHRFRLTGEGNQLVVLLALLKEQSPFSIQPIDFSTELFGIFTALDELSHRFALGLIRATVTR